MTEVVTIGNATLYHADCREIIQTLGMIDAVVTDPPYLMGSASSRSGKGFRSRIGDWTNAALWYADWMKSCWQAMPETGSLWIGGNWRSLPVLTIAGDSFGASMASVVVWDKDWIGVGSMKGLRQRYELIFQFGKSAFGVDDRSEPDIWVVPWSSQRPSGHESEKPVALMQRAVGLCKGEIILDPFMGSGTTGIACAQSGRSFIGMEIDERYFDMACKRIECAQKQAKLFPAALPTNPHEQLQLESA